MNVCCHVGRITKDPEIRVGQSGSTVAKFDLAVERRFKREGQPNADYLKFTAFGKTAEFIQKYCKKGTKLIVESSFQNNNWQNREGKTVYDYMFVVNNLEFAESKSFANKGKSASKEESPAKPTDDDFMHVPDSELEEMPFD